MSMMKTMQENDAHALLDEDLNVCLRVSAGFILNLDLFSVFKNTRTR